MLINGRIWRDGGSWLAESPIIDVMTQGRTRTDAAAMLADAIESLVNRADFKVKVRDAGPPGDVAIEANEPAHLAALVLKRQRVAHGLSLSQAAERLGQASKTTYARYETGQVVPALDRFIELLAVIAPEFALTLGSRLAHSPIKKTRRA